MRPAFVYSNLYLFHLYIGWNMLISKSLLKIPSVTFEQRSSLQLKNCENTSLFQHMDVLSMRSTPKLQRISYHETFS